ncbi:hypothetical protein E5288_WYG015373 [Bos mutus]|uniref:Protein kinase domain-containing protein n=1 Tax=Bos mutus TaxID=72004 RepID=A0A6B0RCX2_9CETA|nr:hypothetical protein [Bos mutus]
MKWDLTVASAPEMMSKVMGATSIVYRCKQKGTQKPYALKVLKKTILEHVTVLRQQTLKGCSRLNCRKYEAYLKLSAAGPLGHLLEEFSASSVLKWK